jgi:hypothetical protein
MSYWRISAEALKKETIKCSLPPRREAICRPRDGKAPRHRAVGEPSIAARTVVLFGHLRRPRECAVGRRLLPHDAGPLAVSPFESRSLIFQKSFLCLRLKDIPVCLNFGAAMRQTWSDICTVLRGHQVQDEVTPRFPCLKGGRIRTAQDDYVVIRQLMEGHLRFQCNPNGVTIQFKENVNIPVSPQECLTVSLRGPASCASLVQPPSTLHICGSPY